MLGLRIAPIDDPQSVDILEITASKVSRSISIWGPFPSLDAFACKQRAIRMGVGCQYHVAQKNCRLPGLGICLASEIPPNTL